MAELYRFKDFVEMPPPGNPVVRIERRSMPYRPF
jgi:hypothetical protein